MIAARLTPGAISVSNSSHLPASDASWPMKPVMFPPGTGQARNEAIADRVGDGRKYDRDRPRLPLEVRRSPEFAFARITSGCRPTNSFANIRIRSTLPAAQRTSIRMLRPSIQPNSASPCVNWEKRAFPSGSLGGKVRGKQQQIDDAPSEPIAIRNSRLAALPGVPRIRNPTFSPSRRSPGCA